MAEVAKLVGMEVRDYTDRNGQQRTCCGLYLVHLEDTVRGVKGSMEEKDPNLFSQRQTRKNAVTGLGFEVIPFDPDDEKDKEIAEFVEAQISGIEVLKDVMLDLLDAVGKGFAVSEIMWSYDGGHVVVDDICSRHQKRFFWDKVSNVSNLRS